MDTYEAQIIILYIKKLKAWNWTYYLRPTNGVPKFCLWGSGRIRYLWVSSLESSSQQNPQKTKQMYLVLFNKGVDQGLEGYRNSQGCPALWTGRFASVPSAFLGVSRYLSGRCGLSRCVWQHECLATVLHLPAQSFLLMMKLIQT